jgi:hypothetical protein
MWWTRGTKDKSSFQSTSLQERDEKNTTHELFWHYKWLKYLVILNPKPKGIFNVCSFHLAPSAIVILPILALWENYVCCNLFDVTKKCPIDLDHN